MKIGAQIMGKAKAAAKAVAGYPPIFQQLASEHGEVAGMIMRILNTDDVKTREETFMELRRNLLAHAMGEEKEVYPPLQQHSELAGLVKQCYRDHEDIKTHVEHLHTTDKSTDAWIARVKELKQSVESHVHREEDELFSKANDLVDREQARMIQENYERFEEQQKRLI